MSYSSHEHQKKWCNIHSTTKHCTATKTYECRKDRERDSIRMQNRMRLWRENCNPGNRYRKRLEPVLPGRPDLRSRKYVFTERRGKVQMEERNKGRKRGRKRENTNAQRGLHCLPVNVLNCYSPPHPSPIPDHCPPGQQNQQQQ